MEMKLGLVKDKVVKMELDEKGFFECKCKELEERCREEEVRCLELELEFDKAKREKEELETIVKALEMEKLGIEDELRNLKRENGREEVVDLKKGSEEKLRVLKLKIEDNEKKMAEKELEEWKKEKVEGSLQLQEADDELKFSSSLNQLVSVEKVDSLEVERCSQETEKISPSSKIQKLQVRRRAPSTSATDVPSRTLVREDESQSDEGETMDHYKENVPVISASKRKRPADVVNSYIERDTDDDFPISKFVKMNHREVISGVESSELKDCPLIATPTGIDKKENCTSKEVEDEDSEELGSDSRSDSFEDDSSNSDSMDFEFDEIMSAVKRNKEGRSKWTFEGEGQMLAAFSRDDVLCLKALCALYRKQTKSETVQNGAFALNQRGYNQCDALRISTLAKFLTDNDPQSDVKKSVKELKKFNPEGVNVCRIFSIRYSKQLFEIYKNKEDPHFLVFPATNIRVNNLISTTTAQVSPPATNVASANSNSTATAQPVQPANYEDQKQRDWDTFSQYLRKHSPLLCISMISEAHVVEFLRYLDQFGKTKVHDQNCHFFGITKPSAPCHCPLRQEWGSLEAMVGRLQAAYEEHGGNPEGNPFETGAVRSYLMEVRDLQVYAGCATY